MVRPLPRPLKATYITEEESEALYGTVEPAPVNIVSDGNGGGGGEVAWEDVTGKPEYIAAGDTEQEARAAVGLQNFFESDGSIGFGLRDSSGTPVGGAVGIAENDVFIEGQNSIRLMTAGPDAVRIGEDTLTNVIEEAAEDAGFIKEADLPAQVTWETLSDKPAVIAAGATAVAARDAIQAITNNQARDTIENDILNQGPVYQALISMGFQPTGG